MDTSYMQTTLRNDHCPVPLSALVISLIDWSRLHYWVRVRDTDNGHQPQVAGDAGDRNSAAHGDHCVSRLPAGVAKVAYRQGAHARGIHGVDV